MLAALLSISLAAVPTLVVGELQGEAIREEGAAFVRAGGPATLTAAVLLPDGRCLAGRAGLVRGGVRCEAVPPAIAASARWFVAAPEPRDYDNTAGCDTAALLRGCHAPIAYRELELPGLAGALVVDAAAVAPLSAPGAHRVGVRLTWVGAVLAAPAALAISPTDATVPAMFELVVRRDDGYVGRLTELLGVPFVLFPVRLPGVGHQTDARLAADCVALVIYGRRRLGSAVGYMAPPALKKHLLRVGGAAHLVAADGRVADPGAVREGDVLHFGFQTAVLSVDRAPLGRLDEGDLVIHSYHGVAEEWPLGELPYRGHSFELLRWPEP